MEARGPPLASLCLRMLFSQERGFAVNSEGGGTPRTWIKGTKNKYVGGLMCLESHPSRPQKEWDATSQDFVPPISSLIPVLGIVHKLLCAPVTHRETHTTHQPLCQPNLAFGPSSALRLLCDTGQVTYLLCASAPHLQYGDNHEI